MTTELSPADQAAALVDNPERYDSLAAEYDDEIQFYGALRSDAQHSLETIEEYVTLRRIFMEYGPTEAIRARVEDRLDRSLKNMVLGSSPRGRAYAVETLAELDGHREAFATLDIEVPSLLTAVRTTVEHLYDEVSTPTAVGETCASLLAETPDGQRAAVEYLARIRLVEQLLAADNPAERVGAAVDTYLGQVSPPAVDERPTAAAYARAAERRSFADPEKQRLYEAALHRESSATRASDYLYLVAANTIEDYRHGGDEVTRADLIVARRQLRAVRQVRPETWDATKRAYAESYRHLADAVEAGGGRWLSARASGPPPEWWAVAAAYVKAAQSVYGIDAVRAVKYVSKAVRHAAHAVEDWATRRQLHRTARAMFDTVDPSTVAEQPDQSRGAEAIETSVAGTRSVHRCRESEAAAHVAFERAAYDEVHAALDRARTAAEQAPQQHIRLREVETVETVAAARQAEQQGDYKKALERYRQHEPEESALRVGVDCHRQLCKVKHAVDGGRFEDALRRAHEEFRPGSAVVVATELSCGVVPGDPDGEQPPPVTDQFLSLNSEAVTVLPALARLLQAGGTVSELLQQQAAACLRAM